MWHCNDRTRKARNSLRKCVLFPLEALERRVLLSTGPSNVLVIYNADWAGDQDGNGVQDSLEVAQYYAQVHGVPYHCFTAAKTSSTLATVPSGLRK
jgi:hypothetical protein